MQSDSGNKFDQGRIKRILALVIDLNDYELNQLIQELNIEKNRRNKSSNSNEETIKV